VLNAIELTKEHFQSPYGNAPLDSWVYDSAQVSMLRQFSASNQMQLMVMNIQAFDKSSTVIQNTKDQMNGRRRIEFWFLAPPESCAGCQRSKRRSFEGRSTSYS
jgi:type III restriction enzyme